MYLRVVYTHSFLSSFRFVFTHCTAVALVTHTHTHSELGAGASQKMKQVSFQRQMKKGFVVLISHFVYFTAIKKQVCKYALLLYRRPAPFPSPALLLF